MLLPVSAAVDFIIMGVCQIYTQNVNFNIKLYWYTLSKVSGKIDEFTNDTVNVTWYRSIYSQAF